MPESTPLDLSIRNLGPRKVPSPASAGRYVSDDDKTLHNTRMNSAENASREDGGGAGVGFEIAGPRENIYFDPTKTRCGIVTCGGLCPGLNDVIRAIVLELHHCYGVRTVYGFQYGYEGLVPSYRHEPVMLDPTCVDKIHQQGGTILASSRGPQTAEDMADALERLNIQVLFCIGGDGTFRGALKLDEEIQRRGLKIAVVGVPKTIDNDIPFTARTFGFETAYAIAADAIRGAHVEAAGAYNGIGLVKLMGRHAGFIAAHAVLASREANYLLVPEIDFELHGEGGFLAHLYRRIQARRHSVVVVAEGAGQGLFNDDGGREKTRDASGNVKFNDIGLLLQDRIREYFRLMGVPLNLKYIDPGYLIRSAPALASDSLFAGVLGQMAAHAGMAGKTGMFVGYWNDFFTHVPIAAAVSRTKRLDPDSHLWQSAIACTGQPRRMVNCCEETCIESGADLEMPVLQHAG